MSSKKADGHIMSSDSHSFGEGVSSDSNVSQGQSLAEGGQNIASDVTNGSQPVLRQLPADESLGVKTSALDEGSQASVAGDPVDPVEPHSAAALVESPIQVASAVNEPTDDLVRLIAATADQPLVCADPAELHGEPVSASSQSEVKDLDSAVEITESETVFRTVAITLPRALTNTPYSTMLPALAVYPELREIRRPDTQDFTLDLNLHKLSGFAAQPSDMVWQLFSPGTVSQGPVVIDLKLEIRKAPEPPVRETLRLPNADVGIPYSETLNLGDFSPNSVISEASTQAGLALDTLSNVVSGVPDAAGEYTFVLHGSRGEVLVDLIIEVTVIPDPKSLWKNIPSDRKQPFWKEETKSEQYFADDLLVVAASKRGRSHAHVGSFRDDDFAIIRPRDGDWHIAVVCDGKGSGAYSREGSRLTVEYVSQELPKLLQERFTADVLSQVSTGQERAVFDAFWFSLVTVARGAAAHLKDAAEHNQLDLRDFDTTFLITAARRVSTGWLVGAFAIGDGGIALVNTSQNSVLPMMTPDSGAAAGETRFLSLSEFQDAELITKRLRIAVVSRLDYLFLMSDGITDAKIPTEHDLGSWNVWSPFLSEDLCPAVDLSSDNSQAAQQLLDWLDFWVTGEHDDRTIVVTRSVGGR